MSEQMIFASKGSPTESLLEFFGYHKAKSVPLSVLQQIMSISSIFSAQSIDTETGTAILKSYEDRNGKLDDSHLRVNRFHSFIKDLSGNVSARSGLLDSVKNLGLLSKSDLEEYAKETGDWPHFLKHAERTVEVKDAD